MRHGKSINHLGRTASHRKALLSNMCISLIMHKRITTTVAKAKELRKHIEPIINRSKEDSTHNRRIVFAALQDKDSIKELFGTISEKVATRPGGYTRIIKLGTRTGDSAEMAMIELVDFNELLLTESPAKRTRRSRRAGGAGAAAGATTAAASVAAASSAPAIEDAVIEEPTAEAAPAVVGVEASPLESEEMAPAEGQTFTDEEVKNQDEQTGETDENKPA
jgi:large subunit ribosomal protein L17